MAETLGSLIDKITIKDIREFHINQMLEEGNKKFSKRALSGKLKVLRSQKEDLVKEIDSYIMMALKGKVSFKDEKIKLYNALKDMGRIPKSQSLGKAISGLANKNLEVWHLEDEARRRDVGLDHIGRALAAVAPEAVAGVRVDRPDENAHQRPDAGGEVDGFVQQNRSAACRPGGYQSAVAECPAIARTATESPDKCTGFRFHTI